MRGGGPPFLRLWMLQVLNVAIWCCCNSNSYRTCPVTQELPNVNTQEAAVMHIKNFWVASTIFLGCLSCISVTKECYQYTVILDILEIPMRCFFFSWIILYHQIWLSFLLYYLLKDCNCNYCHPHSVSYSSYVNLTCPQQTSYKG